MVVIWLGLLLLVLGFDPLGRTGVRFWFVVSVCLVVSF